MSLKIYNFRNLFSYLIIFIICTVFTKNIIAQPVLSLSPVIETGLNLPNQFVNAGDGTKRVFIVQQGGTIRCYDAAFNFLSDFLTVAGITVSTERGLLSLAFHPDYKNNGFFYVYYTNGSGNLELARYHVSSDPNIADIDSKVILITIPHPRYANHNGGELHFGNDGYLYLSTGDGGGTGDVSNNAETSTKLLGKMLRFDVNTSAIAPYYTIPAGNPFGNEVFNMGLRNPYRWSFDSQTFDMWIGDIGENLSEELNFRAADATTGANYGWHCYEGNDNFNLTGCGPIANYVFPVYTYSSVNPLAAITGGIVYRGTVYPTLQGYNISADINSGVFYKTVSNGTGGWTTTTQVLAPTGIADFGETEDGEAYVVSLTTNSVFHITAAGPLPVTFLGFNGMLNSKGVKLDWKTAMETNTRQYEVEYSTNGTSFNYLGTVQAKNSMVGSNYSYLHSISFEGAVFYRLKIVSIDGSSKYSTVIRMVVTSKGKNIVAPSFINNGVMNLNLLSQSYNSLEVISVNGVIILKKNVAGQSGQISVPVNKLAPGVYTVRLTGNAEAYVQKVFIQ